MASIIRPSLARQAGGLLQKQSSFAAAAASRFVARPCIRPAVPVATFHSTAKRNILPPLPQRLQGTANEAAHTPEPHPTHGAYHWQFERLVSVIAVPVTVAPFIGGVSTPVIDAALCATILVHSHIGFEAIIVDYLPKQRVPKSRTFFEAIKWVGAVVVGVGLYEFETNDVGLVEGIKRIWHA